MRNTMRKAGHLVLPDTTRDVLPGPVSIQTWLTAATVADVAQGEVAPGVPLIKQRMKLRTYFEKFFALIQQKRRMKYLDDSE
jgi:hypothetical protein